MKLTVLSIISLLALAACGPHTEPKEDLAQRVRDRWLVAEQQSDYREALSPGLQALHDSHMEMLRTLLPTGYPEPYLPYGELQNRAIDPPLARRPAVDAPRVALGKKLFFETGLSFSQAHGFDSGMSCASCHLEERFFTDGKARSEGIEGDLTFRSSPSLINSAYYSTLTWGNAIFPVLEMQALIPLFNDDPIEMGLRGREQDALAYLLQKDPAYASLFQKAFGVGAEKLDYTFITSALAAFERTLIRFDTRFDAFMQGQDDLNAEEKRGLRLFYGFDALESGDRLRCAECHAGFLLTDSFHYVRNGVYYNRRSFHNTGMYNLDGQGAYPAKNKGFATAAQLAQNPALMGQFRVPPLRFIAQTGPYGHDGSLPDLDAVLEHYAAGGRASLGEHGQNPYVDPLVKPGFRMNEEEKQAIIGFLQTLQ